MPRFSPVTSHAKTLNPQDRIAKGTHAVVADLKRWEVSLVDRSPATGGGWAFTIILALILSGAFGVAWFVWAIMAPITAHLHLATMV